MLGRLTLFLFLAALCLGTLHYINTMIRAFTVFCKLNFIELSALEMFTEAMRDFSKDKLPKLVLPCPSCGAKHPLWTEFASYERDLISFEKGLPITYKITVSRIICSSCGHTHAILPEITIPYSSYSLIFVLTVLRDHYLSHLTVQALCDKYMIATSTLYAWKRLFQIHKRLWLGILEDAATSPNNFLSSLPSPTTSDDLAIFFQRHAQSFLQGVTKTAYYFASYLFFIKHLASDSFIIYVSLSIFLVRYK
jgi:hypothetical protein